MDRRTALRTIGAATAALGIGLASVKPSNGCVLPKSEWQTLPKEFVFSSQDRKDLAAILSKATKT
jgi:hypothetical protein